MPKKLILLTAGFPFGKGETFLETEIPYLAERFDTLILVPVNPLASVPRPLPPNCRCEPLTVPGSGFHKLLSVRFLFHPLFWKEWHTIVRRYRIPLTRGIVFTMLVSLARAGKIKKAVARHLENGSELYAYSYWCDDSALALARLQRRVPRLVTFARIHGWDVFFEASQVGYLPYRQFIAENLKKIFSISERGKAYAREVWKVTDPSKIQVSRLGVAAQKRVVPGYTKPVLVSCSNMIPLKRIELIIQALARLSDTPVFWIHFGDGPLMELLLAQAREELAQNVDFEFKGRLPNAEVLRGYGEIRPSLFINVSSTEGVPVSIMEAMSFGIPVMATDVGGNREIVNLQNGYLLGSHPSPDEIAESIRAFYRLPDGEKQKKADAAFTTWKEQYDAATNYRRFCQEIEALR